MCGGVIFPYKAEYKQFLEQYYSPEEVAEFEKSGTVRSLYWQKAEPVLPVAGPSKDDGDSEEQVELMLWGNRDKDAPFPQTGWARKESLDMGKWSYLKPVPASIPVSYGVEKGNWFEIEHGIEGVVVEKAGEKRVYMVTEEADPEFLSKTHHPRMAILQDQHEINWLAGDPSGIDSALQKSLFKEE
jgi:hypothetical protein